MIMESVEAAKAKAMLAEGATLIDIRDADEFAREHIEGAHNQPVSKLAGNTLPSGPLIFQCRSGMRTNMHAEKLVQAANGAPCFILKGGLDAWKVYGGQTLVDRRQPLEIMRQVQLVAGALILFGLALGLWINPVFFGLTGFVGAGLMFAGGSGWCGMAKLLQVMPWNRLVS